MKLKLSHSLAVSLLISTAVFTSCVDNERDLYDPTQQTANPMGDITAPDGFTWATFSTAKVNVEVDDEFGGQYYYTVEVLDSNPLATDQPFNILAKGIAKKGEPYVTEVAYTTGGSLYIRQIDPRGRDKVKQINMEKNQGTINCSFTETTSTMRSMAATRGVDGVTVPEVPTFTEQTYNTSNATPIKSPSDILQEGKEYIIEGRYQGALNTDALGNGKQCTVYIAGEWIPADNSQGKVHVIVLNGGKITSKNLTMNTDMDLTIQTEASVTGTSWGSSTGISIVNFGTFQMTNLNLNSGFTIFNGDNAKIDVNNLSCNTDGKFNNKGVVDVKNKLSLNSGTIVYNTNKIEAKDLNASSGGNIYNFNKIDIEGTISLNSGSTVYNAAGGIIEGSSYLPSSSLNVNYGTMELEKYDDNAAGGRLYNYCALFVNESFSASGIVYMDHGVIAEEKEEDGSFEETDKVKFYNTTKVTLANGSMIKAETIELTSGVKVNGEGNEASLLKAEKINITSWDNEFSGKLYISKTIVCSSSSNQYKASNDVIFSSKPDITIASCNGQVEEPDPGTDPSNPDFPIITEDANRYTFLFEDQWPLYGDYDMNDIVLEITHKQIKKSSNKKVSEFSLTLDLSAVGAEKVIAAAIMLDGVSASAITKPVQYDYAMPQSFNLTNMNIEAGQDYAVIPLFDNAHSFMGKQQGTYINTVSGSENNVAPANMSFTIYFDNATLDESAFNINKLNVFIITDRETKLRKEIHVAGYQPTRLVNTKFFGANNDATSIDQNKYYISHENLTWGIVAPTQFKWPLEYTKIQNAYAQFKDWVTSGGAQNQKWWNDFDNTKVFQTNK